MVSITLHIRLFPFVFFFVFSHWLANGFVLFAAPYMAYDIIAMYLSHYHVQKVKGHRGTYSSHSLDTLKAFLMKEWMLVLHHLALLMIFLPIALVSRVVF